MERWVVKVISLLIIFFVTLTATLLPIKLKGIFKRYGEKGNNVLNYMMCFGGGVFFSIYMLHMAPDAKELVYHVIIKPYNLTYPVGELLISSGFFLMVFSEKFVENLQKRWRKRELSEIMVPFNQQNSAVTGEDEKHTSIQVNNNHASKMEESDHIGHEINLRGTRSLILLLALSLHHVFEGISVGLKKTETAVWNLTVAIICHEVVIAFSLGLQLVKAYESTRQVVIAAVVCTLMVPIGIGIGLFLIEMDHGNTPSVNMANGILQSIATGVFIYITFFEILAEQISHNKANMKKLLAILFGFTTMALLALVPEETNDWTVELNNNNITGLH